MNVNIHYELQIKLKTLQNEIRCMIRSYNRAIPLSFRSNSKVHTIKMKPLIITLWIVTGHHPTILSPSTKTVHIITICLDPHWHLHLQ